MMSSNGMWIRPHKRLAVYLRDDMACVYCGAEENLTLDHLRPRTKGGSNSDSNLVTACTGCNSSRQHSPVPAESAAAVRRQSRRKLGPQLLKVRWLCTYWPGFVVHVLGERSAGLAIKWSDKQC